MDLTILITASFIPSHPSIKIIKKTIESLTYLSLPPEIPVLLAHDFHTNTNYELYFKNLENFIKDKPTFKIIRRDTPGCLTGNVRTGIDHVKTKFVLILQHDLPFIRKVPDLSKILEDINAIPELKHIRFNRLKNKPNMCDQYWLFGKQQVSIHNTYTQTPGWSDNNHLCLTSYYKDLILKECPDGSFMEISLLGKIYDETSHKKYGTYLFGAYGEERYIGHLDGRFTIFEKDLVFLTSRKELYTPLFKLLESDYKIQVFDPKCFLMDTFVKSIHSCNVCIVDHIYYKDMYRMFNLDILKKFHFVCSDILELNYYGTEQLTDICSYSTTNADLLKYLPNPSFLTRIDNPNEWVACISHILQKTKKFRIYLQHDFDLFHVGHIQMLKQIKTIYPQSSLFVGIETSEHDIYTLEERKEYLRMCKYVDEICEEENVKPTCSFLSYYNIDMIVILNDDEDMYECPTLKVRFESLKTELLGRIKKA